ncbi:HAT, C-terminal dimerisation domain [Cinara cedri]|uniref:HAT, C-terminal dimerisation domain n=1 Tax=Cinara cedri TaxID=506608 RepID=A0A5E4NI24_9HEMI|nr:HAT, C-terminal dimerisation domain [Cinara cedri]
MKSDTVITILKQTLKYRDGFFPIIKTLLHLFAIVSITTPSTEMSFSSLKRLNNCLRSTTGHEHLNGLAVLNVHKQIPIDIDKVIYIFSRASRRTKTVDWSI